MPRFAANLSMLFTELPFLDRFEAAALAGFQGVEFLFPYDYDAADITARLKANGLTQVLFNLPAGNWDAGERGIAIYPNLTNEFRESVGRAARYAKALGCAQLHCLAGTAPAGADHRAMRKTYVENLTFAARALADDGITLLIEPINTRDVPHYFLDSTAKAADVIESVGAPNLRMQYDVYHMQIMEGDLTSAISRHLPHIAHVQIADTPGRNEPGTGEINFPFIFDHLDRVGYRGWVGCEYKPRGSTNDSLAWFRALRVKPGHGTKKV
jgi:hydroxypyruvate isomerase